MIEQSVNNVIEPTIEEPKIIIPMVGMKLNKKVIITLVAVLFLVALYFNKQLRAFFTA